MLLFSTFLFLRQMDIKPGVPNQRAANMYDFSWFVFFIFLEVTSFKKSLGAGITDPAEKLKKIYMIIDHVSLSFRFTWWFIVFLSSQITWWLDVVFSIFTDVGFLLLVYMIFFWFLPLWSTWSYNVFFPVESVFKFSLAAGAEIRLAHLVTETVFF